MSSSVAPSLPSSLSGGQEASLGDDMEQLEKELLRELLMEQGVIGKSDNDNEDDSTLSGSAGAGLGASAHKYDILHDLQKFEIKSQLEDAPLPTTTEAEEEYDRESKAGSSRVASDTDRISRLLPAASIRKILAKIPLNKPEKEGEGTTTDIPNNEALPEESGSVGKMSSDSPDVGEKQSRAKSTTRSISFTGRISGMMASARKNPFAANMEETQKSVETPDVDDRSGPTTPLRSNVYMQPVIKNSDDSSDDRATVPETPPGFRGFIEIPEKLDGDSDSEHNSNEPLLTMKQKYKVAACMAFFLLVILTFCGIMLSNIRKDNSEVTSVSDGFDSFDWTFKPTAQGSAAPSASASPTSTPTTQGPTLPPSDSPSRLPTLAPSKLPTREPSEQPSSSPTLSPTVTPVPTQNPSTSPTFTKAGNFTEIMFQVSPSTIDKMRNPYSVQNTAFRWIIEDDLYYTYNEDRIIQRWVLALLSITLSSTSGNSRALQENVFANWMEYTDECTWAVSSGDRLAECDENGILRNLVFNNANLEGRFPTELYLLTSLRRLVISGNNLDGRLDGRVGNLRQLEELALNHNALTGTIPSQLSKLRNIESIALTANRFTGRIPKEFGELERLTSLDLRNNEITGTVPEEIAYISALRKIELSENRLNGEVPSIICFSLVIESFSTDCNGEVECSCCTSCESGVTSTPTIPPPTGKPSVSPTDFPTVRPTPGPTPNPTLPPTPGPTPQPTLPRPTLRPTPGPVTPRPTGSPTRCVVGDFLEARRSCYEVGENIEVEFGNCDARSDDFFGVYPASADPESLDFPSLWLWTCGDQICRQLTTSGRLQFDSRSEGTANWPLEEGTYKVYIIRNNNFGGNYRGFKETREIEISNDC